MGQASDPAPVGADMVAIAGRMVREKGVDLVQVLRGFGISIG